MKTYKINKKNIIIDDKKTYMDFVVVNDEPKLIVIDFLGILEKIESGDLITNDSFKEFLTLLTRWVNDAPRKRFYRNMIREGCNVLSTDQFFIDDNGEEIINNLENTGKLCEYLLHNIFYSHETTVLDGDARI